MSFTAPFHNFFLVRFFCARTIFALFSRSFYAAFFLAQSVLYLLPPCCIKDTVQMINHDQIQRKSARSRRHRRHRIFQLKCGVFFSASEFSTTIHDLDGFLDVSVCVALIITLS